VRQTSRGDSWAKIKENLSYKQKHLGHSLKSYSLLKKAKKLRFYFLSLTVKVREKQNLVSIFY